jgi:hypothetical protein
MTEFMTDAREKVQKKTAKKNGGGAKKQGGYETSFSDGRFEYPPLFEPFDPYTSRMGAWEL